MSPRRILPLAHRRAIEAFGPDFDLGQITSAEEEYARTLPRQPEVDPALLERAARSVHGVYRCHIVPDRANVVPKRVRILSRNDRRGAVAKDIQSAWFALFGLYVPRTRFEVVPLQGAMDSVLPRRVVLRSCVEERTVAGSSVTVRLTYGEKLWEGRASSAVIRAMEGLAADATLQAVRLAGVSASIEGVTLTHVGLKEVVVVSVETGDEHPHFGVSAVRDGVGPAAARAVLAALNRLIQRSLS